MGHVNVNNSALNNNPNRRAAGANTKLPPPTKGYTRIWIEVSTTARKDKNGQINPSDAEVEKAMFARFGLTTETEAELSRLKERLGTTDNPFDFVKTTGDATYPFRADGKYKIPIDVENSLYTKLSGKAAQVKQQIETENRAQTQTNNPNETVAVKTGLDRAKQQRAALDAKFTNGAGNQPAVNTTATNIGDRQDSTGASEITLTFPSNSTMPLGDRIAGKFLRQTLDPNYDYIWGDKMPDYISEAKTKGFQPEILSTQTNGDQLEVRVRLSPRDAEILRGINTDFQTTKTNIDNARAKAQNETNQMFADQGRVVWNSAVNIVEGTVNQAIDAALTNGGTNPLPLLNPNRPQVDFSGAKADYQSEMMRRDINGKVDGDGIKMGQAVETGVTVIAPLIIGKVFTPTTAPQSLKTLGGLPEESVIAPASFKTGWNNEKILNTPKGKRPNPTEYLDESYINKHLTKFDEGGGYITSKDVLDTFGRNTLGRPDGQFVMPKAELDALIKRANGNISVIEKELGIPPGTWKNKELVRIDVPGAKNNGLRMPSGNEAGANEFWLPGGKLPTGQSEAVINQVTKGNYTETPIVIKEVKK